MVKAEYGVINVCMIKWLGLSHMKKVASVKGWIIMACAGFIGHILGRPLHVGWRPEPELVLTDLSKIRSKS